MVNVIIYLNNELSASELVKQLLSEQLISSASIDKENVSYKIIDGEFSKSIYSVITAQSKALLFNKIVQTVESRFGSDVLINSTPIVGSNEAFNESVRTHTLSI